MTVSTDSSPSHSRKRVRMRDVANRCGVSISTVSLVLSGDPRIPEDTARKILQTVKAMEYRPSVLARSLARRVSRTIGVILPETALSRNQPFYYHALQGIHAQSQPAGYKLVVEAANRVFLSRRYYLRLLKEQSADAMIYLAASLQDNFLADMSKESYPFVLVGAYATDVDLPTVRSNDFEGAKMATTHLIGLGHKAVGHISGPSTLSHGRDREEGFRAAMKEAGLSVPEGRVQEGHFDMQTSEGVVKALVDSGATAIFAGNDVMAIGALRGLLNLKLHVPNDVAVVGMDDIEMAAWLNPALTTVRYDVRQLGELAGKYVIKRIQNPSMQKVPLGEMPAPALIIRSSCGARK